MLKRISRTMRCNRNSKVSANSECVPVPPPPSKCTSTVSVTLTEVSRQPPVKLYYRKGVLIAVPVVDEDLNSSSCSNHEKDFLVDRRLSSPAELSGVYSRSDISSETPKTENTESSDCKRLSLSNSVETKDKVLRTRGHSLADFRTIRIIEKIDWETMACKNYQNNNYQYNIHQKHKPGTNATFSIRDKSSPLSGTEYIQPFLLLQYCQSNNEKKVREMVRKLSCLSSAEVEPIVNYQDQTGRTPLSFACGTGNIMIIDELSKLRRLDPNLGDNEGNTPLHWASQAGNSEAVDLLLSRFEGIVDPNCRNSTGLTPLMKAALQGRTRCCKSLISAGAFHHLRDYSRNLTAIEWARLCGRHICAEIILKSARDSYKHPGSPIEPNSRVIPGYNRSIPISHSTGELKRMNSDESPYYHLHNVRNTISGANWLRNKVKKMLGSTNSHPLPGSSSGCGSSIPRLVSVRPETYALMSNLGDATICASSLLLPSIKPILEQQRPKLPKKLTIPTLQVTPVTTNKTR